MVKTLPHRTWRSREARAIFQKFRDSHGISQREAAKRIGIHWTKLNRWENGAGELKATEVYQLWKMLDAVVSEYAESHPKPTDAGERCRQIRDEHGITQTELAQRTQTVQAVISLFENGYNVGWDEKRIAEIFSVLDRLVEEHGPSSAQEKLFRQVEASLRREIATLEKRLSDSQKTSLASLK